jgi:hypothetical protein
VTGISPSPSDRSVSQVRMLLHLRLTAILRRLLRHPRKKEVVLFYFVPDTTRDYYVIMTQVFHGFLIVYVHQISLMEQVKPNHRSPTQLLMNSHSTLNYLVAYEIPKKIQRQTEMSTVYFTVQIEVEHVFSAQCFFLS